MSKPENIYTNSLSIMGSFFVRQLHTLDTFTFPFTDLNKEWGCDKRYGTDALQRFLYINQRALKYLDVQANIEVVGNDPYLRVSTSRFAGSVPVMSPKDGKPCGDLSIGGRFGEDISELLSVIGDTLLPEYDDALPPLSSSALEPPIYFECCNFIDKFIEVERARWHKFDVLERIEKMPSRGTRWDIYARQCHNPALALSYTNRSNKLKPLHKEFCQLLSVLFVCIREIRNPRTPIRSKMAYDRKIERLLSRYGESLPEPAPIEFVSHLSDPIAVKEAKSIANNILQNKRTNKRAWRIDYSEFFERFVQHLFSDISKSTSSKAISNPRYSVTGKRPTWALQYLEPDLVIQKEDSQYVIDAKYKSHIFNYNDTSTDLKDTFRLDLHQILAYCSFNSMKTKKAMLVYPFTDFTYHKLHVASPLVRSDADVFLVGIPLNKNKLEEAKIKLNELLTPGNVISTPDTTTD